MLKIFKYPIVIDNYFELNMPKESKVLTVDIQNNAPQLWALVDPEKSTEKRRFRFVGTGHPIEEELENLTFISTFQMDGGALIFHIFEVAC